MSNKKNKNMEQILERWRMGHNIWLNYLHHLFSFRLQYAYGSIWLRMYE